MYLPCPPLSSRLQAGDATSTRRHDRQGQHQDEIVICCDAIEAFDRAPTTAMDDDMLTIGPCEGADRRHDMTAGTQAIARFAIIYVP